VSPPVSGKACPSGASFTYEVPEVRTDHPESILDADTYVYKVIDGEQKASVKCAVRGSSTFTFSGSLSLNGEGIEFANGTLDASHKGTATVTIKNSQNLSSSLISATSACTIDAASASNNKLQVKAGSMWAHFRCQSVEAPPSDSCAAEGYFVLENCEQ
jgi:hypothetical protein